MKAVLVAAAGNDNSFAAFDFVSAAAPPTSVSSS